MEQNPEDVIVYGAHDPLTDQFLSWCLPDHLNFGRWVKEQESLGHDCFAMTLKDALTEIHSFKVT